MITIILILFKTKKKEVFKVIKINKEIFNFFKSSLLD